MGFLGLRSIGGTSNLFLSPRSYTTPALFCSLKDPLSGPLESASLRRMLGRSYAHPSSYLSFPHWLL